MTDYKNKFTLDGRLHPQLGVTPKKVLAVKELWEGYKSGSRMKAATLMEAMTTSDAPVNLAHLINLQVIPQLDEALHDVDGLAATRGTPDFRPITLYSLFNNKAVAYDRSDVTGPGVDSRGVARKVPEGTPYPFVTISGSQESYYQVLAKYGLRFAYTWEARINDDLGFFDQIPSELVKVVVDSKYHQFFDALLSSTNTLAAGSTPAGVQISANSVLAPEAVDQAIFQMSQEEINGNKIGTLSGYNLFLPIGGLRTWNWMMERNIVQVDSHGYYESGARWNTTLGAVTAIESERITGTQWALAPKPGATRRPSIEFLSLNGYETPELRVQNLTGNYAGGGAVSPFEGSFDNDSIDYRLRFVTGAALWDSSYVITSTGAGAAPVYPTAGE